MPVCCSRVYDTWGIRYHSGRCSEVQVAGNKILNENLIEK